MFDYVRVASVDDIPDPGQETVEVADQLVVLFHVGGEFFCLDDVCTHDGGPLGDGVLQDHQIACPRHGAKFDIRDGCAKTMPATEATISHHVKVESGGVWVRLANTTDAASELIASAASANAPSNAENIPTSKVAAAPSNPPASAAGENAESSSEGSTNEEAAELSEAMVREELKKVIDPELFVNIIELGLVYLVEIRPHAQDEQSDVYIEMTLTSPMCPAGPQLVANCKQVVGQLPGVADTELRLVMTPPWTPDCMTDEARDQLGIF